MKNDYISPMVCIFADQAVRNVGDKKIRFLHYHCYGPTCDLLRVTDITNPWNTFHLGDCFFQSTFGSVTEATAALLDTTGGTLSAMRIRELERLSYRRVFQPAIQATLKEVQRAIAIIRSIRRRFIIGVFPPYHHKGPLFQLDHQLGDHLVYHLMFAVRMFFLHYNGEHIPVTWGVKRALQQLEQTPEIEVNTLSRVDGTPTETTFYVQTPFRVSHVADMLLYVASEILERPKRRLVVVTSSKQDTDLVTVPFGEAVVCGRDGNG
ncbi:hypothetical protein [Candidatus Caldatribacterium sp.]|uniref:hypothetical protein n=1 Tax=Candidatus Caldatribacterium sp. TaxID=2282143 RepID=UPI00383D2776|nr:hypothetical protein [Candidatus Caldatribacterium sp.]